VAKAESFAELFNSRFGVAPAEPPDGPVDPVLARMLSRRTHRAYAAAPVPDGLIELVLAAALSASSKSDFQQASIIRVKDPDTRAKIAALIPAMPWIGEAPVFLVFCADARRLQRIGDLRGHKQSNLTLEGFFNATVDAALAMQGFILAAEAAGLGCCPISVIRNHMDAVAPLLGLPEGVLPVAGLCVGYPASAGHVSLRLPPSVTVHTDRYDDSSLPAEIDAYDRRRDARHAIPKDKQRAPERFGQAAFYGWSEDKARQAAQPEGGSFATYVRTHGFKLA
jgi:nitroreductase